MIDLRKKFQYYGKCYIQKEKNGWGVGLNGTSWHILIKKSDYSDLSDLKDTIYREIRCAQMKYKRAYCK